MKVTAFTNVKTPTLILPGCSTFCYVEMFLVQMFELTNVLLWHFVHT